MINSAIFDPPMIPDASAGTFSRNSVLRLLVVWGERERTGIRILPARAALYSTAGLSISSSCCGRDVTCGKHWKTC
jgi:hypothetical protein